MIKEAYPLGRPAVPQCSVFYLIHFSPYLFRTAGCTLGFTSDVFILDTVGGGDINLGELAELTVANDFTIDVSVLFVC